MSKFGAKITIETNQNIIRYVFDNEKQYEHVLNKWNEWAKEEPEMKVRSYHYIIKQKEIQI